VKLFGNTLKFLLAQRGLTAKKFAERINLSPTSLSKIVNGVTRPRQANLTRIIQELCETSEEEQQLLSAYAQIEERLQEESGQLNKDEFNRIEEERVRRYLEAKSRSIAFREEVAAEIQKSGLVFKGPYQDADIICDFFIPGPPSIAIECKSNPSRDWDRTITSSRLFRGELACDRVIVAVPALDQISSEAQAKARLAQIELMSLGKLSLIKQ